MKITKDEFNRYEEVRQAGRTNMFHVKNVEALSGLEREKIFFIMKNYSSLKEEFAKGESKEESE